MKKKKMVLIALVGGVVILLFSSFGNLVKAAPKAVEFKLWAAWPAKTVTHADHEMLIDMINEKGKAVNLSIKFVGGPEVFGAFQGCESLQRGVVDMGYTAGGYNVGVVPETDAIKLMQTTPWEDRKSGAFGLLNKWHNEKRLEYLARVSSGIKFQAYLNKKRTKPDLAGVSMRLAPHYAAIIKALGGTGTSMAGGEIYTALERGTIDGIFWGGGYNIKPWGWHEIIKYIWGPGFWRSDVYVLMNKKKFDSLDPVQRDVLREVMEDFERKSYKVQLEEQLNAKKELLEKGLEEIQFSKEDEQWYTSMAYTKGWKGVIERSARLENLKSLVSK
jgi:TRAP-type C4-dicarboxylate transport system substrate-binding protein